MHLLHLLGLMNAVGASACLVMDNCIGMFFRTSLSGHQLCCTFIVVEPLIPAQGSVCLVCCRRAAAAG